MIDSQWSEGEIVDIKLWTDELMSMSIKTEIDFFKPGQFIKVGFIDLETSKPVSRCYSIVSAPKDNVVEIYFNRVNQGQLTPKLFECKTGDRLVVSKKPAGVMTIDNIKRNPNLWLIATGTGIGPFVSMIRDQELFLKFQNVFVIHGVRDQLQLTYRSVFVRHRSDVIYAPCVSRENDVDGVFQGRVTDFISQSRFQRTLSPENSSVVICGNRQMIEEVKEILKNKGFKIPSDSVLYEKYW